MKAAACSWSSTRPFGGRINKAWGLALRKRFCRSFNFELQAAATDNGINISLAEQHSFPLADVFHFLQPETVKEVLEQAVLTGSPIFQTRWRWDANRALALLRFQGGKKVPPQIQRMRADDLLASVFPDVAACLENIEGDIQVPDHPLVREVMKDVLTEAMDIDGLTPCCARSAVAKFSTPGRGYACAVAVLARDSERQSLRLSRRRTAGRAPRPRRGDAPHAAGKRSAARLAGSIPLPSTRCARKRCRMFATPTTCTICCKRWWSSLLRSRSADGSCWIANGSPS